MCTLHEVPAVENTLSASMAAAPRAALCFTAADGTRHPLIEISSYSSDDEPPAAETGDAATCLVLTLGYILALALAASLWANPTTLVSQALGGEASNQSGYHWMVLVLAFGSIIGFGVSCWIALRWRSRRNVSNMRCNHGL